MFRRHKDRSTNIFFVIFRLILSLLIFVILLSGVYAAYKEFSGVDLINLSPKALAKTFSSSEKLTGFLNSLLAQKAIKQINSQTPKKSKPQENIETSRSDDKTIKGKAPVSFEFAIFADSHNENELLGKALSKAKDQKVQFVIGLGDYSEVGTEDELEKAKEELDRAGIRYFVTVGDHDLWDSRNKGKNPLSNFNKFFGPSYQSFTFGNAKIIILDNSDNYLGLGQDQIEWLKNELDNIKINPEINVIFLMLHEPLFHPSSTRVMGKVTPKLKDETKTITRMLKNGGVKEVFAGDIHFFTRYLEPETGLSMTTIGAVTSQRNTQEPRFGIVTVFEDGTYEEEDVEIK